MPPHCDAMDGPVVKAATRALEAEKVDLILPFVKRDGEDEVRMAFGRAVRARKLPEAREVADLYFFDTVVRVHRAGERAPYTGLKPAGLGEGPIIPVAEEAIETGSADELVRVLSDHLADQVKQRFDAMLALQSHAEGPVSEAREYVEAMLGLQVWSHKVYLAMTASAHAEHAGEHHEG